MSLIILSFLDTPKLRHGTYKAPDVGVLVELSITLTFPKVTYSLQGTLSYSMGMMLSSLPTVILTYRY